MGVSPDYFTTRTAEYSARDELFAIGYEVFRIADPLNLFNLIAFKERSDPLFIQVRTIRTTRGEKFQELVHRLIPVVKSKKVPGDVQLWIKSGGRWYRYAILPGGVVLIKGGLNG